MKVRNIFIIFIISAFWHGANWTFIVWGVLNAMFFLPLLLTKKNRNNMDIVAKDRFLPSVKELYMILLTFSLTTFAWIFFRAENLSHAFNYIFGIFQWSIFSVPKPFPVTIIILIICFLSVEWIQRDKQHGLQLINSKLPKLVQWSIYLTLSLIIAFFFGSDSTFIYFQF